MDKPRKDKPKKRGPLYIAAALLGAVIITVGLSRLKPAPPSVEAATILVDTVRRGPLVKAVRGPGTLIPEDIRIIPAVTPGRIEEILVRPGTAVDAGTLLMRLSNPDIELQLLEAERQLNQARTDLLNLQSTLQTNKFSQEAVVANARTQFNEAERQYRLSQELISRGLMTENEASASKDRYDEAQTRLEVEQQRLTVMENQTDVQIASQQSQVERLQQIVAFRRDQVSSMNVVAGTDGVLQVLGGLQQGNLEIGQFVQSGMELGRVVKPGRLKAMLRIPETQAVDVVIGQLANIDTRNGIVQGNVVRIDPAAQAGTVGVDVALPEQLPAGARPDLSVDGNIEITRLEDVLYVGRPPYGGVNSTIGMFKLERGTNEAIRVQVTLGVSSVNHVEVRSGLTEGDAVILSDMSAYDNYDRVRLRR
jgi:HlyD family secretion protein